MSETGKFLNCVILLSGGMGSRMNISTPKQYLPVAGRSIVEHTMYAVKNWKPMDSAVVVAGDDWRDYLKSLIMKALPNITFLGFSAPGMNRQMSVLNALRDIAPYMGKGARVMIHDAVRPMVSETLIKTCDEVLSYADGVMPYLPVKDTVYETADGGYISGTLNRDKLIAGQTPEFYDYHKYLAANEALSEEELLGIHGSTEPAVMAGMRIVPVPGDENNLKITTLEDMERFKRLNETK